MTWTGTNHDPEMITDTLVEVTAEKVIVSRVRQEAKEPSKREIPVVIGAEEKTRRQMGLHMVDPITKKEVVNLMGKEYETTVETTHDSSPVANIMRAWSTTEWKTAEVPGGWLKRVTKSQYTGREDMIDTLEVREFRVVQ
jgi:hypothetical protein